MPSVRVDKGGQARMRVCVARGAKHFDVAPIEDEVWPLGSWETMVGLQGDDAPAPLATSGFSDDPGGELLPSVVGRRGTTTPVMVVGASACSTSPTAEPLTFSCAGPWESEGLAAGWAYARIPMFCRSFLALRPRGSRHDLASSAGCVSAAAPKGMGLSGVPSALGRIETGDRTKALPRVLAQRPAHYRPAILAGTFGKFRQLRRRRFRFPLALVRAELAGSLSLRPLELGSAALA